MNGITITSGIKIGIIMVFIQIFKAAGLNPKFAPIVAVGLGVFLNFLLGFMAPSLTIALVYGIMEGAMAVGIWSGTKNTIEGIKSETSAKEE